MTLSILHQRWFAGLLAGSLALHAHTYCAGQFDQDQRAQLLNALSPHIVTGGRNETPFINPSDFMKQCTIADIEGKANRLQSPTGDVIWEPAELLSWLNESGNPERSSFFELRLDGETREQYKTEQALRNSIRQGRGVFGHVTGLGHNTYSVKYFAFLVWNETAFSGGYGNHEGDWMCVDFQVVATDPRAPHIEYGLFHNHDRVLLVEREVIEFHDGRPVLFLEKGTNEPWPNRGDRGFQGHPAIGVRATKYTNHPVISEYKVVREHWGEGYWYDTFYSVRNLESCTDIDCKLVLRYQGEWGERDWDALPGLGINVHNVTNPKSPRWQGKMWERNFVEPEYRADPRADPSSWKSPPQTARPDTAHANRQAPIRPAVEPGVERLKPRGGMGGGSFEYVALSHQRITGLVIGHGGKIDSIELIIDGKRTGRFGGTGGKKRTINFQSDEYIAAISGRAGRVIDQLVIHTNKRTLPSLGGGGGIAFPRMSVPSGYKVVGIYGRYGRLLDRIGLVVARRQVSEHASTDKDSVQRPAPATWTLRKLADAGGTGGTYFERVANPHQRITGLLIRHGGKIDAIELIIDGKRTGLHGGTGGHERMINFQSDEYIIAISGRAGTVIDRLVIDTNKQTFGPFGGGGGKPFPRISVPSGDKVVGIYGRYGTLLDRIGLIVTRR